MPAVAKAGDVQATRGPPTSPPSPSMSGSWTAGTIVESTYPGLTIGSAPVVYGATCRFEFSGTDNSSGTPVTIPPPLPSSVVSLPPAGAPPTTLQRGASNVLRQGDTNSDTYGNTLSVAATGHLTSD